MVSESYHIIRDVETAAARQKRTKKVIQILKTAYPNIQLALDFSTPLELLIALILAAQCTDERVNRVTPPLFKKYKRARDWATVDRDTLEDEIRTTGFFRQKAASIQRCTSEIEERYRGSVPEALVDLLSLPGVGRKTANILRGNAFGQPAIGVDTHVARVSFRLGFTRETNPDDIENDLTKLVPKVHQIQFCSLVQRHGREICIARKPRCSICLLNALCPQQGVKEKQ